MCGQWFDCINPLATGHFWGGNFVFGKKKFHQKSFFPQKNNFSPKKTPKIILKKKCWWKKKKKKIFELAGTPAVGSKGVKSNLPLIEIPSYVPLICFITSLQNSV